MGTIKESKMLVDDIQTVARGLDPATRLMFCAQLLDEIDIIQQQILGTSEESYETHLTLSELSEEFYDRAADISAPLG